MLAAVVTFGRFRDGNALVVCVVRILCNCSSLEIILVCLIIVWSVYGHGNRGRAVRRLSSRSFRFSHGFRPSRAIVCLVHLEEFIFRSSNLLLQLAVL